MNIIKKYINKLYKKLNIINLKAYYFLNNFFEEYENLFITDNNISLSIDGIIEIRDFPKGKYKRIIHRMELEYDDLINGFRYNKDDLKLIIIFVLKDKITTSSLIVDCGYKDKSLYMELPFKICYKED